MKKWIIIGLIILAVILLYVNRQKIAGIFGIKPTFFGGKIEDIDIGTVNLTDIQSVIDELLLAEAAKIADGDTGSSGLLTIRKKIQILKVEQKLQLQFTQPQINSLMGLSLIELTALNEMTTQELYEVAQQEGWAGLPVAGGAGSGVGTTGG